MRRRRLLLEMGMGAVVLLGLGILVLMGLTPVGVTPLMLTLRIPPVTKPGVTRENYQRIRHGMTLGDVQAIFGKSPDSKPLHDTLDEMDRNTFMKPSPGPDVVIRLTQWWIGEDFTVEVIFADGRVSEKAIRTADKPPIF